MLLLAPARSYRLAAYQAAAQRSGIELIIASDSELALVPGGSFGIAIRPGLGAEAIERLAERARELDAVGVVGTDDATVELASRVARSLGCRHNPPAAVRISRRKDLARVALAQAGAAAPWFRLLRLGAGVQGELAGIEFPCVAKPIALSGSRGVIRCDDADALQHAIARIASIVADVEDAEERESVLVEGFVPGREVAVEGMLRAGELRVLAVFDKPDPLDGPYFEETIYVSPSRLSPALLRRVVLRVGEGIRAFGLREGPIHAEVRVGEFDATVLEIAARTIGGDCARLFEFGAGTTLEELVLGYAVGREPTIEPRAGAAGVMMIPTPGAGTLRRVEGVLAARAVPLVEDVVIAVREGYELVPLPEGASYLGFIFARGSSPGVVEAALRAANEHLRVVVAPSWRIGRRA